MSNKNKNIQGVVYSTDNAFNYQLDETSESETLPPSKQDLRIHLEKKNRAGKAVSVIKGFIGTANDLSELGSSLKKLCGVGGTVKDHEILIQGDFRDKILAYLLKNDYKAKKAGG